MAARRYRGGLLLPLVLVGGGILLLLENFGAIDVDFWWALGRLWPILLIALGLDLILGRSSPGRALSALLTVGLLLAVGFAAFYVFAPDEWTASEQIVRMDSTDAASAEITLSCNRCSIDLASAPSQEALIEGTVTTYRFSNLTRSAVRTADRLEYELSETTWRWLPRWSRRSDDAAWRLSATEAMPIDLRLSAAGEIHADLERALVRSASLTSDEGRSRLVLSAASSAQYRVIAPDLTLVVPIDVGLRIESSAVTFALPAGFVQSGSLVLSPDWQTASTRATVLLRSSVERVRIEVKELDRTDDGPA